jgi:hypothetical protein
MFTSSILNKFTRANGKFTFYKGTAETKLQSIIKDNKYPNVRKDILTKLIRITELTLDRYRKGGLKAAFKWGKGILGRILAVPANIPIIGLLLLPLPSALITSSQENFLKANIRSTIKDKILDEIKKLLGELNETDHEEQEKIMKKRTEDHIKLFSKKYSDAISELNWDQWRPGWMEAAAVWSNRYNSREDRAYGKLLQLKSSKPTLPEPKGPKPTGPKPTSAIPNAVKKAFFNLIDLAKTDEDYTALEQFLEEYKDLVNASDEEGITALMIASDNNNIKLVNFLIENGANVNRLDKEGRSAFFYAKHSEDGEDSEDSKAIQKLLKDNGLRPSSSNLSGGGARTRRVRKSKGTRRR